MRAEDDSRVIQKRNNNNRLEFWFAYIGFLVQFGQIFQIVGSKYLPIPMQ